MPTFTEIAKAEKTKLYSTPIFIQGVMQPTRHRLAAPLEAEVNGVPMSIPAGVVICVGGGGSGGHYGKVMDDFLLDGLDGETYRGYSGMQLIIPAR